MKPFEDNRPLPGGPISIDLLNTQWMSSGRKTDWLVDDEAVRLFATDHAITLAPDHLAEARRALVEARDVVRRLFERLCFEKTLRDFGVGADLVADVDAILRRADVRLAAVDGRLRVAISGVGGPHSLAVNAVVDAIEMLGERPERIRSCEHEDCMLWFVDTSKAGRRRWCSMGRCGNRAKARRHYARSTQPTGPVSPANGSE